MRALSQRLEGILRNPLDSRYLHFDIKGDILWNVEWRPAIAFVLGYKLALDDTPQKRDDIDFFLGNIKGTCIRDLVQNYSNYSFKTEEEACDYVRDIVRRLEGFLLSNQPLCDSE